VRYPLRLLGISLGYQLPGFPVPASATPPALRAVALAERRTAATRATLVLRGLAVSGHASGSLAAPFAGAAALGPWNPAADSADLTNPLASGIPPTLTAWRPGTGAATLVFKVGAGHLIQKAGLPPLPVAGQVALTAGPPPLPVPAIATQAFFGAANAHRGQVIPLAVGNASVPVRLAAEVRAFPAAGAGPALIVDQSWLQEALASQSQPPLPVGQWWLATTRGRPGCPPARPRPRWPGRPPRCSATGCRTSRSFPCS